MAFSRKFINVDFQYESGQSYSVHGLRVLCKISFAGGESQGLADLSIFGMPLSQMNDLSAGVGTKMNMVQKNKIKISAGDEGSGAQTVFSGTIVRAYVDANSQPEVAFRVGALAGGYEAVQKQDPTSLKGSTDVKKALEEICKQAGLQFEGGNFNVKLMNPYFPGSPLEQIRAACNHAGLMWDIQDGRVSVWETGKDRPGSNQIQFSAQQGMVGYPTFSQADVIVTKAFDASARIGDVAVVQSEITPANGEWKIYNVTHDIASEMPNGPWFTQVMANRGGEGGGGDTGSLFGGEGGDGSGAASGDIPSVSSY